MALDSEFRVVGSRTLSDHGFVRVEELEVATPGGIVNRLRIHHPGAVAMLAVEDDRVYLIRQYRASAGLSLLEIPAGTLDVDDEDPEAAAGRELVEEIGFSPGTLRHLFDFYTAPGFTNELMRLYLATDLSPAPHAPDGPEEQAAEIISVALADLKTLLESGAVADAKSLVGLQWLAAQSS